MTDGNTYAINKHLNDQEDYDALQEVTTELEQAEARIEELEAKLAKAVRLMELSVELATWNTTLLQDVIDFIAELKGKNDE